MHGSLLPLVGVDDLSHLLTRAFTTEQESTTSFEESTEIVDVGTGEIVEENFEDVKNDMDGSDPELCKLSNESHIL